MFILTEKPSVAADIANALGGFKKESGYYSRNNDCIIYAAGHLLELFSPEDYDEKYHKWTKEDLPIIPQKMEYKPISEGKKQLYLIKDCLKKFGQNDFILATDPEREGELIGHLILQFCGFTNYSNAKRFWVAEALTPEVVKNGLANAKPLSDYTSYKEAGLARSHADWIVGMNISRLLTLSSGNVLFSFGRVQTAVLGAIYLRDKAIEEFKPIPYNQVEVVLDNFSLYLSDNGETKIPPNGGLLEKVKILSNNDYIKIIDISTQEKVEKAPQLFNITGLQKYCSSQYKLSPSKTLDIAQSLYENLKVLSYPRTPSVVLGDENVDLFLEKYELLKSLYSDFSKDCDVNKIVSSNKRIFNSAKLQDHHALIPLAPLPSSATEEQRQVFNAVLKRFFDLLKPDYIYNSISVKGSCKDFEFIGNGKQVIQKGFKDNFETEKSSDEVEQFFPDIKVNNEYKINEIKFLEKFTKPKSHFNNSSLLSLMENPKNDDGEKICGLGTPATRAEIIKNLLTREYIVQEKQNLFITEKGKFLINKCLENNVLRDFIGIATTTEWEKQLENQPFDFLQNIKEFTKSAIESQSNNTVFQESKIGFCPICKKGIIKENDKSFYCSEYKAGCNFSIWKNILGAKISQEDAITLIEGNKTKAKKMTSKAGKKFSARLILKDGKTEFVFEK